jgi:RNA polymerase sigma-70 factor (ECF subfamily)
MQTVYMENAGIICHFIYRTVRQRELAQDLTSQVFVKALRALDSARSPKSIQTWLFLAARSTIADHYRSLHQVRTVSLERLGDTDRGLLEGVVAAHPPDASQSELAAARVRLLLDRLPQRYREVLKLRFLSAQSIADAAAQMHVTVGNLRVLQSRALKMARRVGQPDAPEESEGAA